MIVLATDDLLVRVDPAHGGEILDLIDPRTGAQYLGRPPFAPLPPLAGELDEDAWTDRYRGGWQTVAPNAGNACSVDDSAHGFHGGASVAEWEVADRSEQRATLTWQGHGLAAKRALAIEDGVPIVETSWRATEWDVRAHPHLWLWEEVRTSGGRWRGQGEMLGVEPASVPHSLGLERAVAEGQARTVSAAEPLQGRITVRPLAGGVSC